MKWEYDWQMHLNTHKCFVMRLTHARHMTRFNYILGDKSLQETDNQDLTWNKHSRRSRIFLKRGPLSCEVPSRRDSVGGGSSRTVMWSPEADAIQWGGSSRIFLFRGLQKPARFRVVP